MADHKSITKLSKCLSACNGAAACVTACEQAFVKEGGKVFVKPDGGKVFTFPGAAGTVNVTQGGKVF
jgi:hypothetical protein